MLPLAIIGMGQRGRATLERLRFIHEAEVVMLCDAHAEALAAERPARFASARTTTSWQEVIAAEEVELIYICTPWDQHVHIAVEAMQHGKHVALEVPAAMTVRECELLVRVSLWTGRHCVMLENCCYDTWHLGIHEMVRQGRLGRITHLEGAYIHTLGAQWMGQLRQEHKGNPYPTHGFGPMCQLLDTDDYPEFLVSLSSHHEGTGYNLNDTLLKTRKGVTMLLQYDTSTPRPYNRLQTVCGTKGFAQKYPRPTLQLEGEDPLYDEEAVRYVEQQIPPLFQSLMEDGRQLGVPNLMNYIMDRRLIDGLQSGLPHLDMEVRETALWSSITELTEQSALRGGEKITIPRF